MSYGGQLINHCQRCVSCSLVLLCRLWEAFKSSPDFVYERVSYFSFDDFEDDECRISSLLLPLLLLSFGHRLDDFSQGVPSLPEADLLGRPLLLPLNVGILFTGHFDAMVVLNFLSSIALFV